ncbi:MAG: hypothetical protein M3077_06725 [Candidatus Dormibacteraeota bacterium]|nr:hypothetical protein [Candidatus Dormibacteraeota bacterium]
MLFVTHSEADLDRWRVVLGPLQFLMVYLVFSRSELSSRSLGICLNLALLASLIVGLVAIAQLTDILPGFRTVLERYYVPSQLHSWDPFHRPTSLLGHYSAVGAFAVLNYSLALAMAATRHPSFSQSWLSLVMLVNVAAVLASLTVAPTFGLLLVTGAVLWYARRVPPHLAMAAGGMVIALVLLSPFLSGRLAQQQIGFSPGQVVTIPQSLAFRIQLWEAFFIPALAEHVWLGTGTVIPSEVPEALTNNVDNEYLGAAFRAGVLGVVLLIGLLVGLAITGWRSRESPAPWRRSLGAASLAYAVLIATIGISAEYLTYGGVSQHIAMVVGLLASYARPQRLPFPLPARVGKEPTAGWRLGAG